MSSSVDDEIAALLAAGQREKAVTKTIEAHGPNIVEYVSAVLRDEDAAQDVFGHFCEELWKSIGSFRGESQLTTWMYTLVMRSVARYRRDGYRNRGRPLLTEEISKLAERLSTTPAYKRTQVKDSIARLRESLEPEEQALLFLRIDQGLPWNEVAAILSEGGEAVEPAALRKRFERAKTRLKKLAQDEGLLG
ncbi:MAG TPA: sigma-70 family RNA polymerase sigma factor [Kofleriaceae bacterium]|nr:sigma-70 family RNA polymerase sigma factor [Kofleriaceae bacterium]